MKFLDTIGQYFKGFGKELKTREKHTAAINVMFWSRALYAIYLRVGSKWA